MLGLIHIQDVLSISIIQVEFEYTERELVAKCGHFAYANGCEVFLHGKSIIKIA